LFSAHPTFRKTYEGGNYLRRHWLSEE
jgi:hypothetical protein